MVVLLSLLPFSLYCEPCRWPRFLVIINCWEAQHPLVVSPLGSLQDFLPGLLYAISPLDFKFVSCSYFHFMSNVYFLLFLPVYIFTSCFYNSLGDNWETVPLLKPIFKALLKKHLSITPPPPRHQQGKMGEKGKLSKKKKREEFISFIFFECFFFSFLKLYLSVSFFLSF